MFLDYRTLAWKITTWSCILEEIRRGQMECISWSCAQNGKDSFDFLLFKTVSRPQVCEAKPSNKVPNCVFVDVLQLLDISFLFQRAAYLRAGAQVLPSAEGCLGGRHQPAVQQDEHHLHRAGDRLHWPQHSGGLRVLHTEGKFLHPTGSLAFTLSLSDSNNNCSVKLHIYRLIKQWSPKYEEGK